jgi:perosamine synthetase
LNDKPLNLPSSPKLQVPLARPWFTDAEGATAREVVDSKWLIFGPRVREFEARFAAMHDCEFGIAVNSGSSALILAMQALGVGAGDEIISPDMTFVSTASSAIFLGAVPRFCDIDPRHHNLDPDDLERRITKKTKLIVPVHYAGHSADMTRINEIAAAHGIPVLEDAAEAHLARHAGQRVGGIGNAGIFSFTPSKPMTTGEGGMITTNDPEVDRRCRLFRNFGDTGKFDWSVMGGNFRMPEVMGAIGLVQLAKLEDAVAERRRLASVYTAAFAGDPAIIPPQPVDEASINFQLYTIRLDLDRLTMTRDEVMAALLEHGVASRLYYPPMHRAGVFSRFDCGSDADFPNTVAYSASAMSLPLFPGLTEGEQTQVIESLLTVVRAARR